MSATEYLQHNRRKALDNRQIVPNIRLSTVVVWSFILMPLVGIVKGTTGFRYAPLLFDGLLFAVFVYCLASNLRERRFDLLDAILAAFLVLAFFQMFNPNVPSLQAGVEGFRKFAFMSITFYLGRRLLDRYSVSRLQILLIFFSGIIAAYGVKQFFHMSSFEYRIIDLATAGITTYMMGGHLRPFSTLPGPFHLGLYLTIPILWMVTCAMYCPSLSRRQKVLFGSILLIEILAVFFTRTKSTWFGLAGGLAFVTLLPHRRLMKRVLFAGVVVFALVITVIVTIAFLPSDSTKVLTDAINAVSNISEAPTFDIREELWSEKIVPAMIQQPLVGYGTSSAGEGLANLYEDTESLHFLSHNLYFKIVLEMGVVGLAIFFLLVGISVYRGFKNLKSRGILTTTQVATVIWCISVVVAFLIAGMAIPVLDAYPANYYFWLLLGILAKGYGYGIRRSV